MPGPRYVLLGLAPPRAGWFRTVAEWAQASSIAAEFGKCVSAEELRARLASNRAFSAVLIDGTLPSVDRDLIDTAHQVNCTVIVVEERPSRREWDAVGADAVLVGPFGQADLMDALRRHASPVADAQANLLDAIGPAGPPDAWEAPRRAAIVVAVCGSGGVGTSTVAMALAEGLARSPGQGPSSARARPGAGPLRRGVASRTCDPLQLDGGVLLADMARRGDLAVLHDARDVVPGLQELVAAHRNGRLTPRQVAGLTFAIEQRGYHLLLGLRRACDWAAIRPRSFEAAMASLRATYGALVCDIDADFEGERDGGSIDVEERNVMSRSALAHADVVLAVGQPGVKGTHSLLRLLRELDAAGAPPSRVVPVCNRGPRTQRARAEMAQALAQLGGLGAADEPGSGVLGLASPIFLPERTLDEMAGHAARLPNAFIDPLVGALRAVLGRVGRRSAAAQPAAPRPIKPGSLGHFEEDGETALG